MINRATAAPSAALIGSFPPDGTKWNFVFRFVKRSPFLRATLHPFRCVMDSLIYRYFAPFQIVIFENTRLFPDRAYLNVQLTVTCVVR